MTFKELTLPKSLSWSEHLNLSRRVELDDFIESSLISPLEGFFNHPGKNIRPRLVELGYRFGQASDDEKQVITLGSKLKLACTIIEAIHSGSLIIDDIQDESIVRRNAPTLHIQHGIPLALNAGNWLYFWALEQIRKLELTGPQCESLVFDCLGMMTRAHYGQALDVGINISKVDQYRVRDVCLTSMELKTGTLFSLAFRLGGSIGNGENHDLAGLGSRLGISLQAYDDLGNFLSSEGKGPSKRHEDLRLRRPTWIWAQASTYPVHIYREFIECIDHLPDESMLNDWMKRHHFREKILTITSEQLGFILGEFKSRWESSHPVSIKILLEIAKQLENSYVKS